VDTDSLRQEWHVVIRFPLHTTPWPIVQKWEATLRKLLDSSWERGKLWVGNIPVMLKNAERTFGNDFEFHLHLVEAPKI
jgi:hypothetical protein